MTVLAYASPGSPEEDAQAPVRGRALAAWRRRRAVEMAMAGYGYDEIAEKVGYSNRGTAWHAVQDALKARLDSTVDEYRSLGLARTEALIAAHWDAATSGQDLRSAELILKVIATEAKLLGLDKGVATVPVVNTVIVGGNSDEYLAALKAIRERSGR